MKNIFIILFCSILLLFTNDRSTLSYIDRITSGVEFDIVGWELKNLPKKYLNIFKSIDLDENTVRSSLKNENNKIDDIEIEIFLENEISKKIKDKLEKRILFPPLDFVFQKTPKVLIISPRNRIYQQFAMLITPDINLERILEIETEIYEQNLSAIIVNTGGFAAYPSLIKKKSNYDYLVSTIAHEWLHQYLFFSPLGQAYFEGGEMIALNESLADIFGEEISETFEENIFYPDDFYNNFMRETRLETDRLLMNNQIEEAETYMNLKTLEINENGYKIRKINQAYFAFHGNYGSSPSSTSDYDKNLRILRGKYDSLSDYIDDLKKIDSIEDFDKLIIFKTTENH